MGGGESVRDSRPRVNLCYKRVGLMREGLSFMDATLPYRHLAGQKNNTITKFARLYLTHGKQIGNVDELQIKVNY